MNRVEKLIRIMQKPDLVRALLKGTPASLEHVEAIGPLGLKTCIDIGANRGQFSVLCESLFPGIRIHAFEPQKDCALQCEKVLPAGARVYTCALGAANTDREFFLTGKRDSSSILPPGEGQMTAYGVNLSHTETVREQRLDDVLKDAVLDGPTVMKLDVQGYELEVLRGATHTLRQVDFVYLEGSFVELYKGQALVTEIICFMTAAGFRLRGVYNNSFTPQFGDTQADFLFDRDTAFDGALGIAAQ